MAANLLDRIRENAAKTPDKTALTFIGSGANGGKEEAKLSYNDVMMETTTLAENLLASGLKKNDLAVLVFPPSLDFTIAFLACLKVGIVAVPVFPPHPARKDTLLMFSKIIDSCNATYALTSASYSHMKKLASLKDAFSRFTGGGNTGKWPENLKWLVTDTLSKGPISKKKKIVMDFQPSPNDLAFLQFTSGSTSAPKGVQITHGNLADNLTKITTELEAGSDTIVASWLPQYHDMGLIGSYLGTLYCGGEGYYMSPMTFLQRPALWMEVISKYRATHLQAPNFSFKLTARKVDTAEYDLNGKGGKMKLDLSSVKHIINAAEPVTEDSINAFVESFKPFELNEEVIYPTYGLAEHTVFVCSGGKQRLTVSKKALEVDGVVQEVSTATSMLFSSGPTSRLIGCGYPSKQDVDVRIVNPDSLVELAEDKVGEIWVRSPSKAAGYYNKPKESKHEFCAIIGTETPEPAGENEEFDRAEGYLRTGDLGFLHSGELFVCGRIKDLIIVGGRNYYPQDLESTAEASSTNIRPGCSAAFTIDPISGDDEEVAIVAEVREVPATKDIENSCSKLVKSIRASVNKEHSLSVSHVVLLSPRTIDKTTSGKIARAWCRKSFVNKTFNAIYEKSFKGAEVQKGPLEIEQGENTTAEVKRPPQRNIAGNASEIRRMDKKDILESLKEDISLMTNTPPETLSLDESLISFIDSLNLSQFKGLLESKYFTKMSDEYLFQENVTIRKLVEVVKLGHPADDMVESGDAKNTSSGGEVGKATGVAGALGCPPGVVCCTVM